MYRTGIVGCGAIAKVHAASLKTMDSVDLVGVADHQMERAKLLAQEYGESHTHAYSSLEELLEKESLDVLHICTPHSCHVPMALLALRRGVHIFMEKPPAITREEFQLLKHTAKECQGNIGICFQNRYNETTRKMDELLSDSRTGSILGARAFVTWNRPASYYTDSGWRGKLDTEGGGALINQAIHTLDLLIRWLGAPTVVEASMANHHLQGLVEVEDTLEAYMTFQGKDTSPRVCFYATTAYVADAPVMIELVCEHVTLRLEGNQIFCRYQDGQTAIYDCSTTTALGKSYWGNGHSACISDFYHCMTKQLSYPNDLSSSDITFQTMMDIYESASNKKKEK